MNESSRKIGDSFQSTRISLELQAVPSFMDEKNLWECTRSRDKQSGISLVSCWSLPTLQRKFCHHCDRTETTLQRQRRWDNDYIVNIEKVVALRSTQLFLWRSQRLIYTLSFIRIMFIFSAEVEYCYFPVDFGLKIFSWVFSEIKVYDIFFIFECTWCLDRINVILKPACRHNSWCHAHNLEQLKTINCIVSKSQPRVYCYIHISQISA